VKLETTPAVVIRPMDSKPLISDGTKARRPARP
jgi:hypothetical protein